MIMASYEGTFSGFIRKYEMLIAVLMERSDLIVLPLNLAGRIGLV